MWKSVKKAHHKNVQLWSVIWDADRHMMSCYSVCFMFTQRCPVTNHVCMCGYSSIITIEFYLELVFHIKAGCIINNGVHNVCQAEFTVKSNSHHYCHIMTLFPLVFHYATWYYYCIQFAVSDQILSKNILCSDIISHEYLHILFNMFYCLKFSMELCTRSHGNAEF